MFSVVTASKKVLVFRVSTGRRCAEVDESLDIVHESQKHSNVNAMLAVYAMHLTTLSKEHPLWLEPIEFGRRLALERELDSRWTCPSL